MSIKFNEEHIPDSPFVVPVASHSDDARRLTVTSLQVLGTPPVTPWSSPGLTDAPWVSRSLLGHSGPLLPSWDLHWVPPLGLLWHPWTLWGHLSLPHVILGAASLSLMSPLDHLYAPPCQPWDSLWCQPRVPCVTLHPCVTLGTTVSPLCHPWDPLEPPFSPTCHHYILPGAIPVSLALILGHLASLCHSWAPWCSPCPTALPPPSCPPIPWGKPAGIIHDDPLSPHVPDATVVSLQETVAVNQPASFAVQLNGARGVIDAKVHTPAGVVEECYVSELDSGEGTLRGHWETGSADVGLWVQGTGHGDM